MKRIVFIWIGLFCIFSAKADLSDTDISALSAKEQRYLADSIMERVSFFAPFYETVIESYKAELYMKGRVRIPKKNFLMRFLPTMFRLKKGVNEYMMESHNELHYTAPDIYEQKVKAASGTASDFWEMDGRLPEYFHINVYAPTLLNDKLLSPLSADSKKYYRYRLDSIMGDSPHRSYKIRFIPRKKSYQLVGGYVVVSEHVWSVREFCFFGRSEMIQFHNHVRMGKVGESDEFLPLQYYLESTFQYLGNKIEGSYVTDIDYKQISQHSSAKYKYKREKSKYDLTDSYTLRSDTNALLKDAAYFDTLRPFPLSQHEKDLYKEYQLRNDSALIIDSVQDKHRAFLGGMGDFLTSRYTIDMDDKGSFRGSPIISPLLLSYSGTHGVSYRQDFRYARPLKNDRLFAIAPRLGYNFKHKEFYWRIASDFYYWPSKNASMHLEVGNGNRIYSSDVLDELKSMPDSLFDFSQIYLDYFNDLYFQFRHSWEIVNGLKLDVGLAIHKRTEVNRSKFVIDNSLYPTLDPSLLDRFRHSYTSFAPQVRLSWTPGQYYYMQGERKINLHSDYPTFSVDYERGIKGVIGSTGAYERVEVDIQHKVRLGTLKNFYYRAGWGEFTNQHELYFVDFANLKRSNLPLGWNDDIAGVFQLLDRRWYNSSRKYVRANFAYESPFILLPNARLTQHVLSERLYLNLLRMPHLEPYAEIGYGIGTHMFDFGLFVSVANWKYEKIGCKFTFELFNR